MKRYILCFLFIISFSCTQKVEKPKSSGKITKPEVGFYAPDISMLSLDGNKVSLSDISSDIVVLNFWLSSCEPCIAEMPHLTELQKAYDPQKLRVVLLAVDSKKNVERFISNVNSIPLVAIDAYGANKNFSVEKFPETFILNKKRIIVDKYEGYQEWNSIKFKGYFKALLSQ